MRSRKRSHTFISWQTCDCRQGLPHALSCYEITHFCSKSLNSLWRICRQQQQQSTSRTWQQGGISLYYSSLWLSIADDKCWFHQPEITFGETRQIICPWIICCRHNVASSIICFPIQMWRSIYSFEWNNKVFLFSMCKFPAYPLPRIYQVVLITLPVAVLYRFPKLCAVILHVR
jgi:hypothetical protein